MLTDELEAPNPSHLALKTSLFGPKKAFQDEVVTRVYRPCRLAESYLRLQVWVEHHCLVQVALTRPEVAAAVRQPLCEAAVHLEGAAHLAGAQKDGALQEEQGGFAAFPHGDAVALREQAYRKYPQE